MTRLTPAETFVAFLVEVIRQLWDRGIWNDNKLLRAYHDLHIDTWIDFRAERTMRKVDKQAKELTPDPEVVKPLYWEKEEGETPLGGPLGYTYRFDDAPGGADPLQGPE